MTSRSYLGRGSAVALVAALVGAATAGGGCKSDGSGDDTSSADEDQRAEAHDYYIEHVHNALGTCIGCHTSGTEGPAFMAADAEESYEDIERTVGLIAAPKNSPLVQYIHKDPKITVSPEQRSVLTTWLSLEATARNLEGAVAKPKTITEAYDQFAKCMNFDVWSYYRMGDLAFTQTDAEGPCLGCHSTGQGSAWLSAPSRETFEKAQQFPFIQKLVVGKLNEKGSFEALQPSNRFIEKANEICPEGSTSCHPRFGLPPAIQESIQGFVETTLENLASGTCNSGIVVPQTDAGPPDAGDGG
jgi:hypothetical protein